MSKLILVIDDEAIITRALSRALTKEGFEVQTASDGKKGLEAILRLNPSLVMLDILMPGMTGLEVLEKLFAKKNHTPVILMTAYGDMNTQKQAKDLGVKAYLNKPFENIDDVTGLVKKFTSGV